MKTSMMLLAGVTAFSSSVGAVLMLQVFGPRPAFAVQSSPASGLTLYAYHRRDLDTQQGFIFYDPRTGDIWVYDNQNAKEHYRLTEIGKKMQKLH